MELRKLLWFLNPKVSLEEACRRFEAQVEHFRTSVAMSIHAEKLLETQYQKNRDLAVTWHNRSQAGRIQENSELVQQALQRQAQYSEAASELETELKAVKQSTFHFRNVLRRLDELKSRVRIDQELILSLPESPDDIRREFQSLLTDCVRHLKSKLSTEQAESADSNQEQWICEIHERLSDIEARLNTSWRNWIGLHTEKETAVLDVLIHRFPQLKGEIESNRIESQESFELWNARVDTATASGKQELEIHAQSIRDTYSGMLAHSSKTLLLVDELCGLIQSRLSSQNPECK